MWRKKGRREGSSSFALSGGERYSYMFRSIVANLFANGLVPSVETILVSDSLKLSVSVEKNAVMLAGAKRFIWTRSCVSERFVSRKIKFSYAAFYASVKCEGSMLHGRRNNSHCKDILSAVEFARSVPIWSSRKTFQHQRLFPADRLPTLYGVALGRLTENVFPSENGCAR